MTKKNKIFHLFKISTNCSLKDFSKTFENLLPTLKKEIEYLHKDFVAIYTPGHTPGSYSFIWNYNGETLLFPGDSLFLNTQGEWDTYLSKADYNEAIKSLQKMKEYSPTIVFPSGSMYTSQYEYIENYEKWIQILDKVINKLK